MSPVLIAENRPMYVCKTFTQELTMFVQDVLRQKMESWSDKDGEQGK